MIRRKNEKSIDILYFIATFLLQLRIFGKNIFWIQSFLDVIYLPVFGLLVLAAILVLLRKKISVKYLLTMILLSVSTIIISVSAEDISLLLTPLLLISCSGFTTRKILSYDLGVKLLVFVVIFLSFCFGLAETTMITRHEEIRYTLGFIHPNTLGFISMSILVEVCYVFGTKRKMDILLRVLAFIVAIMLTNISISRTSIFIVTLFYLFVINIIWRPEKEPKKIKKRSWSILVLIIAMSCFSFYVTDKYILGQKWALEMNKILSGRLWFQSYYANNYEISILGKVYDYDTYPLDNAFYRLLYSYGYLGYFIFIAMYVLSGVYVSKEDDKVMKWIMITLLIYALSEWSVFRISVCPILLLSEHMIARLSSPKKKGLNKHDGAMVGRKK